MLFTNKSCRIHQVYLNINELSSTHNLIIIQKYQEAS
jgi:hypothetical protein